MGTVSIRGKSFDIYGTLALADTYMLGASHGTSWASLDRDTKSRYLVTSARILNRQAWTGSPTLPYPADQPLVWPRTGVSDCDGTAIADDEIPQQVLDASYELALAVSLDATVQTTDSSGTNLKVEQSREKVDVIEVETKIERFHSTDRFESRFPTIINELLHCFLSGGAAAVLGLSFASGTDVESEFTDGQADFGFTDIGLP